MPTPIERWHPGAPANGKTPGQERGRRPTRSLPYAPSLSARLDRAGRLELKLRNRGASAAHFAVYPYAGELERPLHLDVRQVHDERLTVAGDVYRLGVQGPNRFWCELAGARSGDAARVDVGLVADPFWRTLALELENHGDETVTLRLRARAFGNRERTVRLRPGRSRTVEWDTDRGWYDVEVTAKEDRAFRRRFTGRVETGRAGVTP